MHNQKRKESWKKIIKTPPQLAPNCLDTMAVDTAYNVHVHMCMQVKSCAHKISPGSGDPSNCRGGLELSENYNYIKTPAQEAQLILLKVNQSEKEHTHKRKHLLRE